MKTIESYEAIDGTKFFNRGQCERYESELRLVSEIKIPNSKLWHGTYKQHDRQSLLAIKRAVFALVLQKFGDSYPEWRKWDADDVHQMSIVGRVVSEGSGPITNAWNQLGRFNFDLGREYDQPYFALHPDEATPASLPNSESRQA